MSKKPKILVCSESSKVSSGFGIYNKYLLNGLYRSNKYEVAEFASYGLIGDKEKYNIPWKYYPNAIMPNDPRIEQFTSSTENHFGKWRFDRVVLDFRPDIVIDVRDYWMSSYQQKSPTRKYFHWILMPTVDSSPQQEEWLDTYRNADAIFTYSDWGRDVLLNQTSNTINFVDVVSPCADLDTYKIDHNKSAIKNAIGIDENSVVIGTVMRNQKRKLFPELIRVFERVVQHAINNNMPYKDSIILYLHTSYPDAGWDIQNLIKDSQFSNKIFMTYACKKCGAVFASNFSGVIQKCKYCNNKSCGIPNVSNGIDSNILSKIMNIFDVYVQYSICEGFGMPQVEACACGVPVMTINYSAMTDIVNKLGAEPINVGTYFKELETSAIRTYPDHDDCMDKIIKILNVPQQIRQRKGFFNSDLVKKYYSWQGTVDKWIKYIDTINYKRYSQIWSNPIPDLISPISIDNLPKTSDIYSIIYSIYDSHIKKLGIAMDSYWLLKQIQMSQDGFGINGPDMRPFSINDLINNLNALIHNHNNTEMVRTNPNSLATEDYIEYANAR